MKGKIAKYVTVGTNDLERAKSFYDALFEDMGATSFGPNERSFFWTIYINWNIFYCNRL